jgi:glycerol-3-phosphate dehydrogenase
MEVAQLGPEQRTQAIHQITSQIFDVVVIGGGVTGAGTALDAASRGLTVALLEAEDLASGTSSRSGKTFHGGLRYLQQLNFSLVRQAAHERNLMVDRLCPYLTRPTPFLLPLSHGAWERAYMGAGILLYDLLGGARPTDMPGHRHLTKTHALREMPSLRADRITGAVQYYDVIFDDARHTLTVARTAAQYGAVIGTRLQVTGMRDDNNQIAGVLVYDKETGQALEVQSRCVINATGAWADLVQQLAGEVQVKVQPAKGVHVVVPGDSIDSRTGFIVPTADSVLVVRPWGQYWIIGTTDTPWNDDRNNPVANRSDISYLLTEANKWLRTPLAVDDIVGVYAGVRPLLSNKSGSTAALSRDHVVLKSPAGLFTIVGGKYTTYRVMARDVMDAVACWLSGSVPPSVTASTPLLGTEGWYVLHNQRQRLARETGLDVEQIDHLLRRYGSLVRELFNLLAKHPELAQPIVGASAYLAVEAVYAASHEGALHLDDVLTRRTHIAMETKDHGLRAAEQVARLVGEVLGWDNALREQEVARYTAQVKADQLAAQELTDTAAIAARLPFLRMVGT